MASAMDHNYLQDGFYAKSRQEEIPAKTTFVDFLLKAEDVTVLDTEDSLKGLTGAERDAKLKSRQAKHCAKYSDQQHFVLAECDGLFNGNQFIVFVYQRYHDIRLVGAPPKQWEISAVKPTIFNGRVLRQIFPSSGFIPATNGSPAEYNSSNIPLKSKYLLPISLKGY